MDAEEIKEEIEHQRILQKEYRKRLRVLERQAALFGDAYVPPHIQIEIDTLAEKILSYEKEEEGNYKLLLLASFKQALTTLLEASRFAYDNFDRERDSIPEKELMVLNRKMEAIDKVFEEEFLGYFDTTSDDTQEWAVMIMDKVNSIPADLLSRNRSELKLDIRAIERVLYFLQQQSNEIHKA